MTAKPEVVVSLTSFPERIKWAWVPIETMLRQTRRADRIVLVLSQEEFPNRRLPRRLVRQQARGLEIVWTTENTKSYKKLLPTRLAYPEAAIITIDDDCIYKPWLVSRLCESATTYPGAIIGHRGWEVPAYCEGLPPYATWKAASPETPANSTFLTGAGGILYPPRSLSIEFLGDEELAQSLCPTNDDIWFWAVARITGTRIHCLGLTPFKTLSHQDYTPKLETLNRAGGNNDKQLAAVLDHFGVSRLIGDSRP